jgi:hypothetical protein
VSKLIEIHWVSSRQTHVHLKTLLYDPLANNAYNWIKIIRQTQHCLQCLTKLLFIKVLLNTVNSVVFDGLFFIQLIHTQRGCVNSQIIYNAQLKLKRI